MQGHTVAVVVYDGLAMFEYGVTHEVFALERPELDVPWYDFRACQAEPGPLRARRAGLTITAPHGLDDIAGADTVIVPAWRERDLASPPADLLDALCTAHARGARVASLCSGAFVLAAAGLLDGRRATTHWMYLDELARLYPTICIEDNVLYVDDGDVLTSAGSAAAMDLCLHIVANDHGTAVANMVARRAVVPPHRSGGQAQYVDRPLPEPDDSLPLHDVLGWMRANLAQPLTVIDLAGRAALSPRTFARRFRQVTGTTPLQWLADERLLSARQLLETTELAVDRVAERVGFGSAETMRHHFRIRLGTAPSTYRATFRCRTPDAAGASVRRAS
jgi:AraC family transcriptional regulator, transcriptional activator FtrA